MPLARVVVLASGTGSLFAELTQQASQIGITIVLLGEPFTPLLLVGTALVMGLMFVALNTLVDLLCHGLDPRRRQA